LTALLYREVPAFSDELEHEERADELRPLFNGFAQRAPASCGRCSPTFRIASTRQLMPPW
jgi:hypothetical protein